MGVAALRAFKRHYYRVRSVVDEQGDTLPSFSIRAEPENGIHRVSIKTPGEPWTTRFVLLMRRFLNPTDPLYLRHMRDLLDSEFGNEIPAEQLRAIDMRISRLAIGLLGVMEKGKPVMGGDVYRLLADGVYFGERDDYADRARKLAQGQALGRTFLWYEFYEYNLEGYRVASAFVSTILQLEHSEKYQALYRDSLPTRPRCIYCLSEEGPFQSEDHPVPECLGNYDAVLPKGMVCDRCNSTLLSTLDNALVDGGSPLAFLRVLFVPYTKSGKLPETRFQNAVVSRTGPMDIAVVTQQKRGFVTNRQSFRNGKIRLTTQLMGKKFDVKLFGRALYRIALGIIALEEGQKAACSQSFDPARSFILGHTDFANNLLMRMECEPRPHLLVHRLAGPGTPLMMDLYGLIFMLNLQETPKLVLMEEFTQLDFAAYPLHT